MHDEVHAKRFILYCYFTISMPIILTKSIVDEYATDYI